MEDIMQCSNKRSCSLPQLLIKLENIFSVHAEDRQEKERKAVAARQLAARRAIAYRYAAGIHVPPPKKISPKIELTDPNLLVPPTYRSNSELIQKVIFEPLDSSHETESVSADNSVTTATTLSPVSTTSTSYSKIK